MKRRIPMSLVREAMATLTRCQLCGQAFHDEDTIEDHGAYYVHARCPDPPKAGT